MSTFQSNQAMDYPAVWVQINLGGPGGVEFWIVAPTRLSSGIPSECNGWNLDTTGNSSLMSGLPAPGGVPDTNRLPSLLEAIKTWAEEYSWGSGWSVQSVHAAEVTESYTDISPA